MRDLSKEDLTLFQAERHGDVDQAIRILAARVAALEKMLAPPPLARFQSNNRAFFELKVPTVSATAGSADVPAHWDLPPERNQG